MNKLLVCAALGLALAVTEISAKQSCSSFKGKKCEKKGCDWSKTGDAQFKTCKDVPEDVAASVVDTPVVQVNANVCSQYRRGKGCRNAGCAFTRRNDKKSGKRTCNVPETKEPTPAPEKKEVEKKEAIFAGSWDEENGCCRDSGAKKIPQGTRFDLTVGATTTEAMAECEEACAKTSDCTAFELTTKTKGKKKKGKKTSYICELHDTLIDSTTRASKSCKRAVCHIKAGEAPPPPPAPVTAPTPAETEGPTTIPGTASEYGFTTLVTALTAAGLVQVLDIVDDENLFTVFAPTNAAFDLLGQEFLGCLLLPAYQVVLQDVLLYHVANGELLAQQLVNNQIIEMINTDSILITIDAGTVVINDNAEVVKPNVIASNGILHGIDRVLVPPELNVEEFLKTCTSGRN